jgi:demethoxyubiquinone hydroxylase (CLK1/Coq7/Cat5 family)
MLRSLLHAFLPLALIVLAACGARDESGNLVPGLGKVQSLHRGELAAVATYDDAIAKLNKPAWTPELTRMRDEHRDAVSLLAERIRALHGTPDARAGAWGAWAELVTKAAAAIGEDPALSALKTGESHGLREYEEALASKDVDETTKSLIRSKLLDRQRAHQASLETLKSTN